MPISKPSQAEKEGTGHYHQAKKPKTTKKGLFDDDQDDDSLFSKPAKQTKAPSKPKPVEELPQEPIKEPQEIKTAKPEQPKPIIVRKEETIEDAPEGREHRDSTFRKDPRKIAGIMGMGPQLGPLIPAGMVITKPSQAKKQEKIALSRIED